VFANISDYIEKMVGGLQMFIEKMVLGLQMSEYGERMVRGGDMSGNVERIGKGVADVWIIQRGSRIRFFPKCSPFQG